MNLCQYLTTTVRTQPDRTICICGRERKTAAELLARVCALANALAKDVGVQPGDAVALAARNSDAFLEVVLAVMAIGAVVAPLNWRWSLQDAAAALEGCRPVLLVVDAASAEYATLAARCASLRHLMSLDQEPAPSSHDATWHSYNKCIAAWLGTQFELGSAPENIAAICFTSGSTGAAKGAMLTHTAFHCQAVVKLREVGFCESDMYLHTSPLCHVGGLSSAFAVLLAGGTHVFIPQYSASAMKDALRVHQVTAFIAVPAMLEDLLNGASDTAPTAISTHVKRILVGAAPLSRRLAAACRSAFPMAAIVSAYGMTEACSSICFSRELPGSLEVEDMAGSPESSADDSGQCVGCPPPGIEVAADMMTDEICVRGPNILLRYCGTDWQPEAGGWFRTGDLGKVDGDGNLWLLGRLRDVIRSGGETVHAREVELIIEAHTGIAQAAVVGVPHQKLGEQVAALVCLQHEYAWAGATGSPLGAGAGKKQLTSADVVQHCMELGLSRFKLPKVVIAQHAAVPTVSNGKTSKPGSKARILAAMSAGITYWDTANASRL